MTTTTTNPRTIVSATTTLRTFIIWPRPEIQSAWRAVLVAFDGSADDCRHNHRSQAAAEKCGRRAVRTGNRWA